MVSFLFVCLRSTPKYFLYLKSILLCHPKFFAFFFLYLLFVLLLLGFVSLTAWLPPPGSTSDVRRFSPANRIPCTLNPGWFDAHLASLLYLQSGKRQNSIQRSGSRQNTHGWSAVMAHRITSMSMQWGSTCKLWDSLYCGPTFRYRHTCIFVTSLSPGIWISTWIL